MKSFATFRFNKRYDASQIGGIPCGPNRRSRGVKLAQVAAKSGPSINKSLRASGDSARGSRFNKVGKHWLTKPAVIIRSDGREICNPATAEGCADYKWRIVCMWVRQHDETVGYVRCCNCLGTLALKDATFEHEALRGKDRDDRIALFDETGRFVRNINGVSHLLCNSRRGSRRTEIWHGENFVIEKESA